MTDEHNTAETHTNSDECQRPIVLTFRDENNEPEGEKVDVEQKGLAEDDGYEYEVPHVGQVREPSTSVKFLESHDSIRYREDSEPSEPRKDSEPLQSPPVLGDEKDLLPNAVLVTSPSLLAGYLPRLPLGSLSGRFPPPRNPAEIHASRT